MSATDQIESSSFADSCFRTTHLSLNLFLDFKLSILEGSVTLNVIAEDEGQQVLVLDTRQLTISSVTDLATGENLAFRLLDEHAIFGSALHVTLPTSMCKRGSSMSVNIRYQTSPSASGIQWLTPAQTAGKTQPYMFTQCQAIHARSVLPCQDTPAIKCPYSASVSVMGPLTVLMSANQSGVTKEETDAGVKSIFSFEQPVHMPSYLIALVAGDLVSRDIGPRSRVWSERELIEQSAFEFSETEEFIATAEALLGPYVWGRYDLLVLPPSFPYGGMENPCLTFVTPTLIAGDRSLANVVAHEVTHSWMGNLVTNRTWSDFWLNEGHTRFVEDKIIGRLEGEPARHLYGIMGMKALQDSVDTFGPTNPLTALVPEITGVDPDDAFSSVPYEKGANLLWYLETLLGGPAVFEPFLRGYVDRFKFCSLTTHQWKTFLYEFFSEKAALLDTVDWQGWFYAPGMPPVENVYDNSLAASAHDLALRWVTAKDSGNYAAFGLSDLSAFSSKQVQVFLDKILLLCPTTPEPFIEAMNTAYQFTTAKNNEIRFKWQMICVKAGWESIYPYVVQFLGEQGRMKYVRPLYRELHQVEKSRALARKTFNSLRMGYHNIAASLVEKDLSRIV